jgi:hypothetical protein
MGMESIRTVWAVAHLSVRAVVLASILESEDLVVFADWA